MKIRSFQCSRTPYLETPWTIRSDPIRSDPILSDSCCSRGRRMRAYHILPTILVVASVSIIASSLAGRGLIVKKSSAGTPSDLVIDPNDLDFGEVWEQDAFTFTI